MIPRLNLRFRFPVFILMGALLALLSSGCMWGVVRDADTGKPIAGVKITLTDTQGQTLTTTSDANGLFGFGAPVSAAPARGPVNFQVETAGYQTIAETRDVLYDDNPNASFANLQSFWDVQTFNLDRGPGGFYSEAGGFGVTFPADWEVEDVTDIGDAWGAVQGNAPSGSSDYPASCLVMSGPLPAGMTLRAFVDAFLNSIKNMEGISMFQKLEVKDVQVNGLAAVRAVFSYKQTISEGSQRASYTLKHVMYFIGKNDKAFDIDCMTFIEKFSNSLPVFEKIVQSFKAD